MRPILVTGANKGIGLQIVHDLLDQHDDTVALLGSRNAERGQAAIDGLVADHPDWAERLHLVPIDVSDDASVAAAGERVHELLDDTPLYGLVNNAGIGLGDQSVEEVLQVNTLGVRRVTEAMLPRIQRDGGRIVNITSGSAPNYVETVSERRLADICGVDLGPDGFAELVLEVLSFDGPADFEAAGLGSGQAYGLSKALGNAYTRVLAEQHPDLVINACTPGFIETDLTRPFAEAQGKDPSDMGMKPVDAATKAPLKLLFADLSASGWYFGSDAERSPMHRYRSPGDPPYAGDDEPTRG